MEKSKIIDYIEQNILGHAPSILKSIMVMRYDRSFDVDAIAKKNCTTVEVIETILDLHEDLLKTRPPHYPKLDPFTIAEHYPHLEPKKFSGLKYLLRAGQKEGVPEVEDLKKLIDCIERRIKEIEGTN